MRNEDETALEKAPGKGAKCILHIKMQEEHEITKDEKEQILKKSQPAMVGHIFYRDPAIPALIKSTLAPV
ncbi:unnamed protein product [Wuchereria bancrofti]|uniref:Uncharacterized protein n=1 Tax=Wuchereria bancrofti TaxID=6293 RepID=A0A3P7FKD1_WUCBA|nr:unnamed protein product [Wuchereria bancrofti]